MHTHHDRPPRRSTWNIDSPFIPDDSAGCGLGCVLVAVLCILLWSAIAVLVWELAT